MAVLRIRLCDADRDTYGGPEWVTLDTDALADLPASQLEEIEEAVDGYVQTVVTLVERDATLPVRVRRICAWLARRQAQLVDEYDKFDPRILRAQFERQEDDADPPEGPGPSLPDGLSGGS